ncbi:hypothetical protein NMY22_g18191 [Coprinellus aureogranulatus]|nr:hypothetical protein NMY22_g18191 [Coprinellus aureogranulatus]
MALLKVQTDADLVLASDDLGGQLVSTLSWTSLENLRTVNHGTLAIATSEQADRLKKELSSFLPLNIYDDFIARLVEWRGGFVGSVIADVLGPLKEKRQFVTRIAELSPRIRPTTTNRNLNVLIPRESWEEAMEWLKRHGFANPISHRVAPAFRQHVVYYVSTFAPGTEMMRSEYDGLLEEDVNWDLVKLKEDPKYSLTLSAFKTSLVKTLLAAPFGSQTALYTGTCLVDLFPDAHIKDIAFYNGNSLDRLGTPRQYWLATAAQDFAIIPSSSDCNNTPTTTSSTTIS